MKSLIYEIWIILKTGDWWKLHPKNFLLKDPCKICLVQPCCLDKVHCEIFYKYRLFTFPWDKAWKGKFFLAIIYLAALTVIACIFLAIFE